jgi:hypothetical protein
MHRSKRTASQGATATAVSFHEGTARS